MPFDMHTKKSTACECDRCGGPLQTPDVICSACETAMEAEARHTALVLPYTCPACDERLADFETYRYPESAPWYRPTTYRTRCPRCKTQVRRKYETRLSRWIWVAAWVSWYVLVFEIPFEWSRYLGMCVILGLACYRMIQDAKAGRDPEKYVRDERN